LRPFRCGQRALVRASVISERAPHPTAATGLPPARRSRRPRRRARRGRGRARGSPAAQCRALLGSRPCPRGARQSGQPVPGVLRRGRPRSVFGEGGLQPLLLDASRGAGPRLGAAGPRAPRRPLPWRARRALRRVVGGGRSRGRGSDCTAARRAISASAERRMTAQLGGEVGESRELAASRRLAERLLLALQCLGTPAASSM
jgi:hypothetical protein